MMFTAMVALAVVVVVAMGVGVKAELSLNYSSPVFSLASTSFRLVHSMV